MSLGLYFYLEITAIFTMLSWSIYILFRNGQLYYVPISTMGIGAYFVAITLRDMGWPFEISLLGAIMLGIAFSFILALGLARASTLTMIAATIGIIIIIQTVIRNMKITGGEMGLFHIPEVPNLLVKTFIIILLVGILIHRLDNSRIGRAMSISSIDQDVAATLGVNIYWTSVCLQMIAGGISALCGGLYAATMSSLQITPFGFSTLLLVICFIFVGGCTTMWGPVIFTPILYGIPLILPESIAEWKYIIYGLLLIGILTLRPEGLIDKRLIKALRHKISIGGD
jgi:branched-chain amino acid transport system permease protein